jgi:hypothetical protein
MFLRNMFAKFVSWGNDVDGHAFRHWIHAPTSFEITNMASAHTYLVVLGYNRYHLTVRTRRTSVE